MREIIDSFNWDKERKLLTNRIHNVRGLKNFAHYNLNHAAPTIPLHYHSNIIEFHCLTKGRRDCVINGTDHIITGNELFLTFPYEEHQTGSQFQWPCEFYTFQFCFEDKKNLLGLNDQFTNYLMKIIEDLKHRHLKVSRKDIEQLKNAFELFTQNTPLAIALGTQYLCCFLFNLPNLKPIFKEHGNNINPSIKKAVDYIDNNIKEKLVLSELAQLSGYSLTQFKVNFKNCIGINPSEYINLRKIQLSIDLLENTDKSISDIAMEIGFNTSNYFSSVFKKFTTFSPAKYKLMKLSKT